MSPEIHFVGRETELEVFRHILAKPYGEVRIPFVLGDGGIGKTQLVRKMLAEAKASGVLAPEEPLDLFSTDLRHIDGIQLKIIKTIEDLTSLKNEKSPFAEFFAENRNTSEQFNRCIRTFCEKKPLVLAFDTFENLDTVASNWLFESGNEGLLVPGLICIVASRLKKEGIDRYRSTQNAFVREIVVSGLTLKEAGEFYQNIVNGLGQVKSLDDLLMAAGIERGEMERGDEGIEWVWQITKGHPLKLEMAFRWAGKLLREDSLKGLTAEMFEEKLMEIVCELSAKGLLDVGAVRISQPVFDTLICMGYAIRRFDERLLNYLIDEKHIRLGEPKVSEKVILDNLERYFFVKSRSDGDGRFILQLHDEMARLVRDHVWPFIDPPGEKKKNLLQSIIKFYDLLISEVENGA